MQGNRIVCCAWEIDPLIGAGLNQVSSDILVEGELMARDNRLSACVYVPPLLLTGYCYQHADEVEGKERGPMRDD